MSTHTFRQRGGEQALRSKLAKCFSNVNFEGRLHKYLDIRFEDPVSGTVVLVETKQHATDTDQSQIETYFMEEVAVHPRQNYRLICILCSTEDNYFQVWKNGKTLDNEKSLKSMSYYIDLYLEQFITDIQANTKCINEMLHANLKIKRLTDRMIFTAAILTTQRLETEVNSSFSIHEVAKNCDGDYDTIIEKVIDLLEKHQRRLNSLKIQTIKNYFTKIQIANDPYSDAVIAAMPAITANIESISKAIQSTNWRGQDVMAIFFNEFNRYRGKADDGQVFTPQHISSFMYRLIDVHAADNVGDFTCGSGTFLCTAMANMMTELGGYDAPGAAEVRQHHLYGIEFDGELYALACANMLLHKDGKSNIEWKDARSNDACAFIKNSHITKILMNPPYENKFGCMEIVRNVLDNVEPGAKCAFLLPENKLEKTPGNIVADILTRHRVTEIIKLPTELFDVGVTVSCFIFDAHIPQKDTPIWGCYIEDDGLVRVKNQGRHDLNHTWTRELEDYWVDAVRTHNDSKYNTGVWINPAERLSYPIKVEQTELTKKDFAKTAFAYLCFKKGIPPKDLLNSVSQAVVYASEITSTDNELNIKLRKG